MDPIFYTVTAINGDYADLLSDGGQPHSITMFLLPEGTTVGSRLKLEHNQWELVPDERQKIPGRRPGIFDEITACCCGAKCPSSRRSG